MFPTAHRFLLGKILENLYPKINGRVLVVGAGKEPYRVLLKSAERVVITDVGDRHFGLDAIADAHKLPFRANYFDYVLAIEVFEHLQYPSQAAGEILRVLKPGGEAITTVPFMFRVHGDPHDYHRFTDQGLAVLFESFTYVRIQNFGGRIHAVSDIFTSIAKPLVIFRCVNLILGVGFFAKSSKDCPSGYIVSSVK